MKSPDFDSMSKEKLLKLIKSVRNSLIGCEDAGDTLLGVAELLQVDMTADADNEES